MLSPETFDQAIDGLISKSFSRLKSLLYKPFATLSDPLFRKNLGERYFTGGSLMVGLVLWSAAVKISSLYGSFAGELLADLHAYQLSNWAAAIHPYGSWVGYSFCIIWGWCAGVNLMAVHVRQTQGIIWHSMSRGESWFGKENPIRDFVISVLISVFLLATVPVMGIVFIASCIMSRSLANQQQATAYKRYLDKMDAQIEQENLERSLDEGVPPEDANGIYGPLPKKFKGEHRSNIAKMGADAPVRIVSQQRTSLAGSEQESSPQPKPVTPRPKVSARASEVGSPPPQTSKGAKTIIKLLVVTLVCVGAIWGYRTVKAKAHTGNASAATANSWTPAPSPLAPPIAETQALAQPSIATNQEASLTKIPSTPVSSIEPTKPSGPSEEEIRQQQEKARAEAEKVALEQKRAQEIADMEKFKNQIGTLITNQLNEVPTFQANSTQILTEALKKTGPFSTKRKAAIKQLQALVDKAAEGELATLHQWQAQSQSLSQNQISPSDRQLLLDKLTQKTQALATLRQQLAVKVMQYKKD